MARPQEEDAVDRNGQVNATDRNCVYSDDVGSLLDNSNSTETSKSPSFSEIEETMEIRALEKLFKSGDMLGDMIDLLEQLKDSQEPKRQFCSQSVVCDFESEKERERKRRNNEASKRSRCTKNVKFSEYEEKIDFLNKENTRLKEYLRELDSAIDEGKKALYHVS